MSRLCLFSVLLLVCFLSRLEAKAPIRVDRAGQMSPQGLTIEEWIEAIEAQENLKVKRAGLNVVGIMLSAYTQAKNPGDPTLTQAEIEAGFECYEKYLSHEHPSIRSLLVRWLAVIPHESAIKLLGGLLQKEQTPRNVEEVLEGLGRHGKPEAIPHLKTFWGKNMSDALRLKLLETFVEIGGDESVEALNGFKQRANARTQQVINQAIRAILVKQQQQR